MVVRALWPLAKPHLIDRLLFWVAALSAANLIVRPLVILSLTGGFANYEGFQQSIYWTTVQFSQAIVSVLAAISLMVAIAKIGRASCRERVCSTCRSRWSPYH